MPILHCDRNCVHNIQEHCDAIAVYYVDRQCCTYRRRPDPEPLPVLVLVHSDVVSGCHRQGGKWRVNRVRVWR